MSEIDVSLVCAYLRLRRRAMTHGQLAVRFPGLTAHALRGAAEAGLLVSRPAALGSRCFASPPPTPPPSPRP
jgi:hypothetical protein